MRMSPRARRAQHLEDIVRLRALYALRGPEDGQAGITPDGRFGQPERWRVASILEDANAAIRLGPNDHARWRAAMGIDPMPETTDRVMSWSDDCPARLPGLSHMRSSGDPSGVCSHCHLRIR